MKKPVVYAFIDSQNLNLAIRDLGWKLDFARFRIYLREKFGVEKAYIFLGYVASNDHLYSFLKRAGFHCVFRPTLTYKDGTTKGNCDAELVLQAMIDFDSYDQAVIVSGDGDFYCLVKYLIKSKKLNALVVPNRYKYSALLKLKPFRPFTRDMNNLRNKLEYAGDPKKKSPRKDETLQGTSPVGDTKEIIANQRRRIKKPNEKDQDWRSVETLGSLGHGDKHIAASKARKVKRKGAS